MMTGALRVLYVDDEPDLLEISKLFLEDPGFHCNKVTERTRSYLSARTGKTPSPTPRPDAGSCYGRAAGTTVFFLVSIVSFMVATDGRLCHCRGSHGFRLFADADPAGPGVTC